MSELCLVINPDIVILHRNGVFFTSKLINNEAQLQLKALDLLLLHRFLKAGNVSSALDKFLKCHNTKALAPRINMWSAQDQLNKLTQSKVLISSESSNNKKFKKSTLRKKNKDLNLLTKKKYRLSNNFSIIPSSKGFKIWSSIKNKYIFLGLEELLIIFIISNGNNFKKIRKALPFIKKKVVKTFFLNLIKNNLLVKQKKCKGKKQKTKKQILNNTSINSNTTSWEDIDADTRIPVYFVPHMENHYPLALGLLFSSIIDYKKGCLLKHFNLIPITYFTPEKLLNSVYRKFGRGIWLFSNYMWSEKLNLEISKLVKRHDTRNVTIHGGPSTPNYVKANKQLMDKHPSIDISVHGEGEIAICEILKCINNESESEIYNETGLSEVTGVTFRKQKQQEEYIRTKDRQRMESPDDIPSPYSQGVFDSYKGRVEAAIIESNRGCPFGCTFCDWGSATNQKVRKYDLERTKKEIKWIAKNNIPIIWIADANFGMYDRDIELSSYIIKVKEKYGYPKEVVVNYTKNTTWRLAEIIKIFTQGNIISQGIISIQTTDKTTLEIINRKNIKVEKYDELACVFAKMNLPLSTDLMLGLPGITVDAFNQDIQRYIDLDVSVKAYPTQLLPNSPMADPEYIDKYKIVTDQNDFIISTFSFSEEELLTMKQVYKYYTIADGYSLLRYVLRYLQWEYDVKAIDFLNNLMLTLNAKPEKYPLVYWTFKYFDTEKRMPGGWKLFYDEISKFIIEEYNINQDSALETVIYLNKMCMPDDTQNYPIKVKLKHDFVEYFNQRTNKSDVKLRDFKKSKIKISDPNHMVHIDLKDMQYDTHQYFWELQSDVARAKSVS